MKMTTEENNKSLDMMLDEIRARLDAIEKQGETDSAAFSDIQTTLDAVQVRLEFLEKAGEASARVASSEPVAAPGTITETDAEWMRYILGKYFFDDRPAVVAADAG